MFGVDELGMDLGTSTLHIVVRGKGIVLSEPAYVAYDRQTRNVVAVGEEARRMYGRTPAGLIVERPLRDGRIRSFDLVSKMLRYFMRKVIGKRATFRPKLLLALPGGMAPSERQTLVDVLVDAGVRSVVPVDESVASAIGAGMRIDQPYGRMNIDIGGGRTNVSVFSFGHQIVWDILNVGGDRFDDAIIDYLRKKHNLLIGARTAEELKIDIGSARMRGVKLEMDACGRSLVSGLPRAVTVSSEEMIEALDEPLRDLMSALHRMIERTPPELASDIFDEGITLSGGGAQLFGLDGVTSDQLKIRTTLADEYADPGAAEHADPHAGHVAIQRPEHMGGLVRRQPADDDAQNGGDRCAGCAELADLHAGLQRGLSRAPRRLDGQRRERFAGATDRAGLLYRHD